MTTIGIVLCLFGLAVMLIGIIGTLHTLDRDDKVNPFAIVCAGVGFVIVILGGMVLTGMYPQG